MSDRNIIIICIIVIVGLLGFQQYIIRTSVPKEDILIEKINRLEFKLDSLNTKKDSVKRVIDSTHVKIVNNENYYKEVVNTIIYQSTSADSSFITNYIRLYRNQRDSSNIR